MLQPEGTVALVDWDTPEYEEFMDAVRARIVADGGLSPFYDSAKATNFCSHPVRLHGSTGRVESETGELLVGETDHLFLKACGNRRRSRCVACSDTYRHDARHLVLAGLAGGKKVPESVGSHPMLFGTLTAPSFGAVHHRARSGKGACHPSSSTARCRHGRPVACFEHHQGDDPRLGEPICPDCYRYEEHVVFHGLLSELWRRTTIYVFRALARELGTTPGELAKLARLSYVKVAEYQTRGAVHLHVVLRADGAGEGYPAPPEEVSTEALLAAFVKGSRSAYVDFPVRIDGVVKRARWGRELDVSPIDSPAAARRASRYLSKYVTKSTESSGVLDRRIGSPRELAALKRAKVSSHHRRLVECAVRLSKRRELKELNLVRSANAFGFAGHVLTKSRRYSTTFKSLRLARYEYQEALARRRAPPGDEPCGELVVDRWRYGGSGYGLPADHVICEEFAQGAIEARADAWYARYLEAS